VKLQEAPALRWSVGDIDFSAIDVQRVRGDDTLYFVLATSALVEAATHHYAANLADYYAGDAGLAAWLRAQWQPEELQHGLALRSYTEAVWPEFDWSVAFGGFYPEYAAACTREQLEPSPALELAARCVVETGTATLYQTLHDYTDEPVLRAITARLKSDEIRHYGKFLSAYERFAARERPSRWQVARAEWRRVREAFSDDGQIAFRHAFRGRYPARNYSDAIYREFQRQLRERIAPCTPVQMTTRMLLKPLALRRPWQALAVAATGAIVRLAARPRPAA
jgi:hypothetical protein